MSDTKQTPKPSTQKETVSQTPQAQKDLRERLLSEARRRMASVDVGDDRKADDQERKIKEEALKYIQTECLGLPEDRFSKLLDAIVLRMKQKEAYKSNLLEGFRKDRQDIAKEVAASAKAVPAQAEKLTVTQQVSRIKPLGFDKGPEIFQYDQEILTDAFDPVKTNLDRAMPLLEMLDKYPTAEDQLFRKIRDNNDALAGFLIHWKMEHPAFKKLAVDGRTRALGAMGRIEGKLRNEFAIDRNPDRQGMSEKEFQKTVLERIAKWKNAKYSESWNRIGDAVNGDRKIFKSGFASKPLGISEAEYTTYVLRSANYLEYAANRGGEWLNEILRQFKEYPEAVAGIVLDWKEWHQIRKTLAARGKNDVVRWVDNLRSETMRRYGINPTFAIPKNRDDILTIAKGNTLGTGSMEGTRKYVIAEAFDPTKGNPNVHARYLNYIALPGNEREWANFVSDLRNDRRALASFLANWNPKSKLAETLLKTEGSSTVARLENLKALTIRDYGIPPTAKTFAEIESFIWRNGEIGEKRMKLERSIAGSVPEYQTRVRTAFEEMKRAIEEGKPRQAEKIKARMAELDMKVLRPLRTSASEILDGGTNPNGERIPHPQERALTNMIAAIEIIRNTNVSKDESFMGKVFGLAKDAWTDANRKLIESKEAQFRAAMEGKELAVSTLRRGGITGTGYEVETVGMADFDKTVREKSIDQVNTHAFREAIVLLSSQNELNAAALSKRWGEFKLVQIAIHWGVNDGNFQLERSKSSALKALAKERPEIAQEFIKALETHTRAQAMKTEWMNTESANLSKMRNFLKGFGIDESKVDSVLERIRKARPIDRLVILQEIKGKELQVSEIEKFFGAKEATEASRAKLTEAIADKDPTGALFVGKAPGFAEVVAAVEAEAKQGKKSAMQALAFLRSDHLTTVEKSNVPGSPRERKLSELDPESKEKLSELFAKHAPDSPTAKYLSTVQKAIKHRVEQGKSATIGGNAEVLHKVASKVKTEAGRQLANVVNNAIEDQSVARAKLDHEIRHSPKGERISEGTKSAAKRAVSQIEKAAANGVKIEIPSSLPSESRWNGTKKIENGATKYDSGLVIMRAIASGAINDTAQLQAEIEKYEAALGRKGGQEASRRKELVSSAAQRTEAAQDGRGDFGLAESIHRSSPGEPVWISDGIRGNLTDTGGLEIVTSSGRIKFDSAEAEGAIQLVEQLKEMGAEFLIPAIKEIAGASETLMKDGIGRNEAGRIIRSLSLAFGYESVANEPDPVTMLSKFRTASTGALGGGTLMERARRFGIVDELGTLKNERLRFALDRVNGKSDVRKEALAAA